MIDTIFYFANTMKEYRDLVEEQQISARTIVFVEETLEIYKNGKLYPDISGVKKAINNASTKSWLDTVRAIGELNNELREAFNASIKDTNDSLAKARTRIEDVKTTLGKLTDSQGNALIDTDKAKGLILLFAEYWNVDNQTYTNFENIWNAQAGKAGLTGEFVNTVNSTITTYRNIVDIVNANKDEWIKFSDVANASETEISEEWDAAKANAIRKLKKVDTIDQKLTTIYEKWQIQEDGTSVWDTLNAQVTENTTALSGILTLVNTEGALASLIAAYTDGNLTFLSDLKTHADGDESYFDLTAAKILGALDKDNENKVAAKIFGYVKNNVSNLELTADNIQIGENVTLKDDLTEIRGLLHVADTVIVGTDPQILIDSTNGIKHTGGKFQINMDGSGFFGNENSKISWTPDGAITATGINIVGSSNVPEGWLDLVNTVSKLDGYSYLGNNGITFTNDNDTIILSLADGLKHYKTANNTKSGYNLKNDGSGYVANKNITWNTDGSGNIGGDNGISWNTDGTIILGSAVEGKSEGTTYAYLTSTGILFNNTNDKVELKSPSGTNGGLIHTYKEDGQDTNNHGYALYNDGSGLIANNVIHWDNEGNLTIGYKSNDPEGPNNSLTWDKDGNLIIGANFIVQGPDYSLKFSDIDTLLAELDAYNKARTYITDAGIIIDNHNTLNRVTLATSDVGLLHQYLESYTENGETKYRLKTTQPVSAYGFYNDGHGYIANGVITWDLNGNGSIGTGDKKITWTSNGELVLGSGLIVGGGTTVVENPYDDTELENAIKALELYNTDRAYLKNTGILFENRTDGNLVGLTSVDPKDETSVGGLIHTYIDANGNATTNPPTHGYALYNNGTGELANGHIKWGLKTVTEEQNGQQVQVEKAWLSIDADDLNIYSGKDGQDGKQGADGQDGKDGENITEYIDRTITNNITNENGVVKQYINTTITGDMSDYLKTSNLGSAINNLGIIKDWALNSALDDLVSRVDGIQDLVDNLDLGEGVTETKVLLWISNNVNTYMLGKDFITGSDLVGFVQKDELTTSLKFQIIDKETGKPICVDQDGNMYIGDFGVEEVEENEETVTKKYFISNNVKYYWSDSEGAYVNGDIKLTPLTITAADMTAGIDKLNTYFIAAIDLNGKQYKGQFFVDNEGKEYFLDEDGNKYYLIVDKTNANYGKYYAKINNVDYYLTKNLGLASSVDIKSQVNDYITNETALSSLTTWADNIVGLKDSGKAGFTLQALLSAITGAPLTAEGNDSVSISGLVDAYNSSLELSSSQIITGVNAQTNAKITLESKLIDLEGRTFASALEYSNVKNTVKTINEDYLKSTDDISDKVLGYLKSKDLIKEVTENGTTKYVLDEKSIDLSKYTLKSDYTEAIAGLITKINNAESSMVSTTTREAIIRRDVLLDKKINGTITDEELGELTVIELNIARRDLLIAKKQENGELVSYEQEELDGLIRDYGNKENPLENLLYEYITTENRISSAIGNKVASIDTYVTKESIFNEENGTLDTTKLKSGVKISADDIYLNGTTWAQVINADSIISKQLHSYSGQVSNPTSTSDGYHVDISNGVIEGYSYSNNTKSEIYKFNADGSGYIGNNFSWTTGGVVTLSGVNAASVQTSSNGFHVDVMNGYIKGYTTGHEDTPIYVFNNDGSGHIGSNFSWDSTGNVTLTGLIAESVQTSKNNFHVDVTDGYIKGYTTNNENVPSYYFKNDGGGSLAYGNITWDTLDLNITVGEHSIILFLEKIDSSNQNANVNPLYFTNGGNTYNGYELSNLGFVLYHGANNGGYETVLSSEGFKVFKHSENGVYNTQLELTPYGTGILANGNILWTNNDSSNRTELNLENTDITLTNCYNNIVINKTDLSTLLSEGGTNTTFFIGTDLVNAYTGELEVGNLTLTFINGILVQQ